jgi:Uma2 family endonuclease
MVWVIDPEERSVSVYEQPDEGRVYKGRSVISGGDVLTGFTVTVAELFDV